MTKIQFVNHNLLTRQRQKLVELFDYFTRYSSNSSKCGRVDCCFVRELEGSVVEASSPQWLLLLKREEKKKKKIQKKKIQKKIQKRFEWGCKTKWTFTWIVCFSIYYSQGSKRKYMNHCQRFSEARVPPIHLCSRIPYQQDCLCSGHLTKFGI